VTLLEFRQGLWQQKSRVPDSLTIVWCCLHDPRFSCFGTMLARDRRTEEQMDTQRQHILR